MVRGVTIIVTNYCRAYITCWRPLLHLFRPPVARVSSRVRLSPCPRRVCGMGAIAQWGPGPSPLKIQVNFVHFSSKNTKISNFLFF